MRGVDRPVPKLSADQLCCRTIHRNGPVMALNTLVFASSQVILGLDIEDDRILQLGTMLPKRYASPWPSTIWTNWCCLGTEKLHLQFHVRALSVAGANSNPGMAPKIPGLSLERDSFRLTARTGVEGELLITETRVSIGMLTTLWTRTPNFTLVTLADAPRFSIDCLSDQYMWTAMGLQPADDDFAGVAIFQFAVGRLVIEWEKCWTPTLIQMSQKRKVKVGQFSKVMVISKGELLTSRPDPGLSRVCKIRVNR
jgi:hypothetical protein